MSTHRFDHKVDRRFDTEASRGARVEVITGVECRRDWTDEAKLAIVAESCEDGVVISEVARRHGLRPQQLFAWRNEFRRCEAARRQHIGAPGTGEPPAFAPVMQRRHWTDYAAPITSWLPRILGKMSLIGIVRRPAQTCKLNSINPQAWLADVLTKLVNRWPAKRIDELMPSAYVKAETQAQAA